MKILYFSPHPHINMAAPSGPGTHIREVINGLESHGHEVIRFIAGGETLAASGHTIQIKKRSWKKLIPQYLWQSLRDLMLFRLDKKQEAALIAIIEKERPDFVYERSYYLMGAGYRACKKTGVRYCCEMNAPYPEEKKQMNGASLFDRLALVNEKRQLLAAEKIYVVSSALKNYVCRQAPGIEEKVVVIPNAVNPVYVEKNSGERQHKPAEITEDSVVLGFVGSIFPYHGVDALIEVFAKLLQAKKNNLHLLIVGDGEILQQLKQRTSQLGIEKKVTFTGNVAHDQVYGYISQMDITIMARSNWYGSPVKIFEYGLMGKCIIAPDVLPVRDVMVDGEDGLLVQDNPEHLQKAIERLLADKVYREKLAKNFQQKVIEKHTWAKVSEKILKEMT